MANAMQPAAKDQRIAKSVLQNPRTWRPRHLSPLSRRESKPCIRPRTGYGVHAAEERLSGTTKVLDQGVPGSDQGPPAAPAGWLLTARGDLVHNFCQTD